MSDRAVGEFVGDDAAAVVGPHGGGAGDRARPSLSAPSTRHRVLTESLDPGTSDSLRRITVRERLWPFDTASAPVSKYVTHT